MTANLNSNINSRTQAWNYFYLALPWLVLVVSLLITFNLWRSAQHEARHDLQNVFDAETHEIMRDLDQRMKVYTQVLSGVQGLFAALQGTQRNEFILYIEKLHLQENYPGIRGLGFSLIVPPATKSQHIAAMSRKSLREDLPVYDLKLDGKGGINTSVVDMYVDLEHPRAGGSTPGMRRVAMERARDSGRAAISGKMLLAEESGQDTQAGFLMYMPVYRKGKLVDTVAERRANIIGWVYAVIHADELMNDLVGEKASNFDFEIYDGKEVSDETRMHDSDGDSGKMHDELFHHFSRVEIAGHYWTVVIRSLPAFEAQEDKIKPQLFAAMGTGASLMLMMFTWLQLTGRKRALQMVRAMGKKLDQSEERANWAIAASDLVWWDFDLVNGKVYLSDNWSQFLGGEPKPTVTTVQDLYMLVPEEERPMLHEEIAIALKDLRKSAYQVTHRVRRYDGEYIWVLSEGRVVERNADGWALRMSGTNRNITERIKSNEAMERISLLYKMQSEMNSASIQIRERNQLFDADCRIAVESGLFLMAWVGLLDKQSGDVTPVAQAGHVDGYLDNLVINIYHEVNGSGPVGMAIKTGDYQVCKDIASDPAMAPWKTAALERGYRAVIAMPLYQTNQVIGAFLLYFHDPGLLTEDIIQLLNRLAEDISFTLDFINESQQRELIQNELHELSVFLQSALENERKRIARELHDELGQTMTALHFDLRWLHENIDVRELELQKRLKSMESMLERTVNTVRRISEDLRPGMLDDLGLAAAIEHHVEKFMAQTGITCELFISDTDFNLEEQAATAMFRIVQESLTNVARHSGASRVKIDLLDIGDNILLIIEDNGRGLPSSQDSSRKTYGLLGMRERVKMLEGTLDIFNEAGAGARIEVCIQKCATI